MYYVVMQGMAEVLSVTEETALAVALDVIKYNPNRTVSIYRLFDHERVFVRNPHSRISKEQE